MSERKVLNKYYPPDFDPSKIPRLKLKTDRQYTVRLMAPFNMKCKTCGEYIYKGKKFNARKETVLGQEYLGIKIFRFYIKCTRCLAEITFKTDPQNADYEMEHGATRNFQALRLAEEQAEREAKELEDEATGNPMKLLENRTKQSKQEMQLLETLEDMKELNQRHARIDHEALLLQNEAKQKQEIELQEEEDEKYVKSMFGSDSLRRLPDPVSDNVHHQAARKRVQAVLQSEEQKSNKQDSLERLSKMVMIKPKKAKLEVPQKTSTEDASSSSSQVPVSSSSQVLGGSLGLLAGYDGSSDEVDTD